MIVGIGIDIVEIDRIKKLEKKYKDQFYKKILSDEEIIQLSKNRDKFSFIAGRFAVKEALIKAISCDTPFYRITILNSENGKAYFSNQKEIFKLDDMVIHISISHEKKYATAIVVVEIQ